MNSTSFFKSLNDNLSDIDQRILVDSFKQDPHILHQMRNEEFFSQCLQKFGNKIQDWSLGEVALISIGAKKEILKKDVKDKFYLKEAISILDETFKNHSGEMDFKKSTFIALALFERKRKNLSWSGLVAELAKNNSTTTTLVTWKTSLAILFSLLDDDQEFLRSMLNENNPFLGIGLINHIVAAQFISRNDKAKTLINLFEQESIGSQIYWLQSIPSQIAFLADQISSSLNQSKIYSKINRNESENQFDDSYKENMLNGFRFQLENSPIQARSNFQAAKEKLQKITKLLDLNLMSDSIEEIQKEKINYINEPKIGDLTFGKNNSINKSVNVSANEIRNKGILANLTYASDILDKGDGPKAREIGKQQFQNWLATQKNTWTSPETVAYIQNLDQQKLFQLLDKLGLDGLASEYVQFLRIISFPMEKLQNELVEGLVTANQYEDAYSELKITLSNPGDHQSTYKKIFSILSMSKNWDSLIAEWEDYSKEYSMNHTDWLNYADATLNANDLSKTHDLLEKMQSEGVNPNKINLINGKLLFKEGDFENARNLLEDSTKRIPESEDGWIVLSEVYKELGQVQKSIETLRSAVLSIPDSPVIHFNLAKLCSDQELYAEALPYYRKAVAINPNDPAFYQKYIQTLQILGRGNEADSVINQAREKWPVDPELAYIDAVRQTEKQNRTAAISAFEVSMKINQEEIPVERLQKYIQTLLGDRDDKFLPTDGKFNTINNLITSQKILQKVNDQQSHESSYSKLLLAEIYSLVGETEAANSMYSKLMNEFKENSTQHHLLWRVYAGMGLVKLALNEIDSGIAALQEADQLNSKHLGIKQKIAEAYQLTSLGQQAEAKAEEIFQFAPTDVDNLLWFSEFMATLGNKGKVQKGFEQILHFDSSNPVAITRLADLYISKGDIGQAYEVLQKLNESDRLEESIVRQVVISYLRIEKIEEALNWFSRITDANAGEHEVRNTFEKIYLLFLNQMWDQALIEIQYLKKIQSYSRILATLEGDCLLNKSDYDAAVNSYEIALSENSKAQDKNLTELVSNSIIPENWITKKVDKNSILFSFTKSLQNAGKYELCLSSINEMIKLDPGNPWLYLLGADYSMQLTDYELVSDYLLKYKNSQNGEFDAEVNLFAMGLDYATAYLDGREYRITFKVDEIDHIVKKILNAHQLLDKNLYEDAYKVYQELSLDNRTDSTYTQDVASEIYSDLKESIQSRLAMLLSWRLHDYEKMDSVFENDVTRTNETAESTYLKLVILTAYKTMRPILDKYGVSQHRSVVFEKKSNDPEVIGKLRSEFSKFGTTKVIKNLSLLLDTKGENSTSAFSLLNSKSLPKYLNYVLVDSVMKQGKKETIDEFFSNFKSDVIENLIFISNQNQPPEELVSFVEDQIPSDDPLWLMACSDIYERSDLANEAIEFAEHALRIWSDEVLWSIRVAKLYQVMGNFENANFYWSQIVQNSDQSEEVIYQYADLLLENKKPNEVLHLLETYKEKLSDSYNFNLVNAKANLLQKSYNPLINRIQAARKYFPQSLDLDYLEAEAYLLNAEPEKSKTQIQKILIADPHYQKAYILNARILSNSEKFVEASKVIDAGLVNCPEDKGLMIEKIKNLRSLNDQTQALLLASELSQKHSKDIEILEVLANLYYDIDDIQASEMVARKSLHLNPNQPGINYLLGLIAKQQGQLDQALDHFTKAVSANENDVSPWLEMGEIYIEQQETEKALQSFREAYSRDEKDYRAYYQSGLLLRDMKDYAGAEKMLKIASSLSPKDASIRRQLAGVIALNLVHAA